MNTNPFKSAKILGEGITYEVYSQQPDGVVRGDPRYIMSRSELMEFVNCPKKWLNAVEEGETTKALSYGTLMDCLVMMPDQFDNLFWVRPDTYVNEGGEEKPWNLNSKKCRAIFDANADRILVSKTQLEEAMEAVSELHRDAIAHEFITCSKYQVMAQADYVDDETGIAVPVRVLTDLLPDSKHPKFGKSVGDFKTSADASPREWAKAINSHGYDTQAALNLDIHSAVDPAVERIEFRHVIQESSKPWQTGRRIITSEFIEIGRAKYLAALKLYAKCLKRQFWPDYEIGTEVMNGWSMTSPKPWMVFDSLEYVCKFPDETDNRSELELNYDTTP